MGKIRSHLFDVIAIAFSIFQLYTATLGRLDPFLLRIIHLYFALVLTFLILPKTDGKLLANKVITNILLLLTILTGTYLIILWVPLTERFPLISPLPKGGIIFGIIFFLLLLEAVRRHMGKELVIVVLIIALYVLFGKYMPGIFKHLGYSIDNIIDVTYLSTEGTFGETLGISASYLYLFILFGSLLVRSGLGELVTEAGKALAGHLTGGPAKIATIACAAFGMISGSAVSGVLTIGTFTIPLMKSVGVSSVMAGGIIAVAASGDIIMPPVMGAIVFLMSQYSGVPYGKIIFYAFLPALLYFFCIFCVAHFDAKKRRLPIIPKDQLPHLFPILRKGWYLAIPVGLLIALLTKEYSMVYAILFPIYTMMAIILLLPGKGLKSKLIDIVIALRDGAKSALLVATALAVGNLIEGLISITGVALKFSTVLVQISPNVYVLLLFAAISLFLLGLALPSFIIYITAVPILVPPLVKFGLDPVAVHLFLVYWGVLSMITPPTGASFYAAAGVAQAPVMKVGWAATRIAAPIYLLTFVFVLHPALVLRGQSFWETFYYLVPAVLGIICISSANVGYLLSDLVSVPRIILIFGGIFLIYGHLISIMLGMIALLGVLFYQKLHFFDAYMKKTFLV